MIYTSYFAALRKLPLDIIPISICGKAPDWYHGIQFKVLAPKYDFFMKWKQNHDNDYYIKCFNEQVLNKLNPIEIITRLNTLAGGQPFALICYEKPGDFCHRHLVADWLIQNCFEAKEYGV